MPRRIIGENTKNATELKEDVGVQKKVLSDMVSTDVEVFIPVFHTFTPEARLSHGPCYLDANSCDAAQK